MKDKRWKGWKKCFKTINKKLNFRMRKVLLAGKAITKLLKVKDKLNLHDYYINALHMCLVKYKADTMEYYSDTMDKLVETYVGKDTTLDYTQEIWKAYTDS